MIGFSAMSGNTFGKIFKITTFGESHGETLGVIIDGCPSGIEIDLEIDGKQHKSRKEHDMIRDEYIKSK